MKKYPPPKDHINISKNEPVLSFLSFFPCCGRAILQLLLSLHVVVVPCTAWLPSLSSFSISFLLSFLRSVQRLLFLLAAFLSFLRSPVPPAFSPRTRRFFLSFLRSAVLSLHVSGVSFFPALKQKGAKEKNKRAPKNKQFHSYCGGPTDHIHIRISHSGSQAQQKRGIPEILLCRILMFIWSYWALIHKVSG